ncbi:MAG: metal ABC transporter substrate-binding protein [Bacillota bacterium]
MAENKGLGRRVWLLLAAAVLLTVFTLAGCGKERVPAGSGPEPLKVVTTTSLIADIVEGVGADRVTVANIIPPASCPGHFDVKPADMQVLAGARIFFVHAWQGELFTDDLIRSVRNEELQKVVLAIQGNWMTPPVRSEAIEQIAAALAKVDPDNAGFYAENAAALQEETAAVGSAMKSRLEAAGATGVKVLVSEMQTGFLRWAGLDVVAAFGRPEDTSPRQLEELLALGRQAGVTLVVDNLQSGHEAGKSIARELGAAHVTLSNFPGGFPDTATWALAIERNVELLLGAIAE